ncbi:MAG: tRNA uridine-5-carboxymethylaminomethyl(34) synthesis GTPase MnmE [Ruminococcaceae bacterium]|nr:tRNA uridine-5-carboxymethylaminomethyl(34) synthesis GTPase MnmE [Oscillospiraceae bacterium]
MQNRLGTTIAAISTPRGKGGIAVIRISGPDAVSVASAMFTPKFGGSLIDAPARRAIFGTIFDSSGNPCDEGMVTVFRAPASFTGEDSAEIACHGGVAVTSEVYMSALAHGAVQAGPGEFTRRAFINGKMSLTEAEAVGLLIDADTKERMQLSGGAVRGNVSRAIERIAEDLLSVMTALYAAIDYPEEDVGDDGEREIGNTLKKSADKVSALLSTYKTGKAISDGVRSVICGRPNVGKSSLFNLMTGEDSAIVTSIAGTTRDILRETVSFGGVTLRLSDTAGIHRSDDTVEKMGIDRANREIEGAELVIAVFDGSEGLTDEDRDLVKTLSTLTQPKIAVINKTDIGTNMKRDELELIEQVSTRVVYVCAALDNTNGQELEAAVSEIFGSDKIDLRSDAIIWDVRQREKLEKAYISLTKAATAIENGDPIDCVCTLAEDAMAALNETDGRGVEERIVNEIFARFCVGK